MLHTPSRDAIVAVPGSNSPPAHNNLNLAGVPDVPGAPVRLPLLPQGQDVLRRLGLPQRQAARAQGKVRWWRCNLNTLESQF